VVRGERSYIQSIITDADHCFVIAGFSTIIEGLLAAGGIQKKLMQQETKCVSMGYDYCELFKKGKQKLRRSIRAYLFSISGVDLV